MSARSKPCADAGTHIPRSPGKPLSVEVVRADFHIVSPVGVLVMTTDCAAAARRYVLSRKHDLPGLRIEKHTITRTVERIYTPRSERRDVA